MIFKTNTPEETKQSFEAFYRLFLNSGSSGGTTYVDRGTVATADFAETDLTINDAVQTLDLSSIIPDDAVMVLVRIRIRGAAEDQFLFYAGDYASGVNATRLKTQINNIYLETQVLVPVIDGNIKYNGEVSLTDIDITICGWWL